MGRHVRRILVDQGEVEEEEEVVDAVASEELVQPLEMPGPAPRIRPPF